MHKICLLLTNSISDFCIGVLEKSVLNLIRAIKFPNIIFDFLTVEIRSC